MRFLKVILFVVVFTEGKKQFYPDGKTDETEQQMRLWKQKTEYENFGFRVLCSKEHSPSKICSHRNCHFQSCDLQSMTIRCYRIAHQSLVKDWISVVSSWHLELKTALHMVWWMEPVKYLRARAWSDFKIPWNKGWLTYEKYTWGCESLSSSLRKKESEKSKLFSQILACKLLVLPLGWLPKLWKDILFFLVGLGNLGHSLAPSSTPTKHC